MISGILRAKKKGRNKSCFVNNPNPPILAFGGISLLFLIFFFYFPCFLSVLLSFSKDFKGSAERAILAFFGGSLPFNRKKQGLEGQKWLRIARLMKVAFHPSAAAICKEKGPPGRRHLHTADTSQATAVMHMMPPRSKRQQKLFLRKPKSPEVTARKTFKSPVRIVAPPKKFQDDFCDAIHTLERPKLIVPIIK